MKLEELQIANDNIASKIYDIRKDDIRLRKEFAKAFNWYKKGSNYNYKEELEEPSWEEIFVKVGELLRDYKEKEINEAIDTIKMDVLRLSEENEDPSA